MKEKADPEYRNHDWNPVANMNDLIWMKDKSLSKSFCKKMIKKFDESDHQYDGKIGLGELNRNVKQTRDLVLGAHLDEWQDEDDNLFKALAEGINEYREHCEHIHPGLTVTPNAFDFHDTGYQIQRYEPEGFYEWHNDWTMENDCSRVYTYIWYLNTIKKKDGGYTQFIDGTKVQPKAGRLVLFPATWVYVHRGFPPKVRKYICTGWVYAHPGAKL